MKYIHMYRWHFIRDSFHFWLHNAFEYTHAYNRMFRWLISTIVNEWIKLCKRQKEALSSIYTSTCIKTNPPNEFETSVVFDNILLILFCESDMKQKRESHRSHLFSIHIQCRKIFPMTMFVHSCKCTRRICIWALWLHICATGENSKSVEIFQWLFKVGKKNPLDKKRRKSYYILVILVFW